MPADLMTKGADEATRGGSLRVGQPGGGTPREGNHQPPALSPDAGDRRVRRVLEEFWAGIGFLAQTAKNNEFGLLVPGVARSSTSSTSASTRPRRRPASREARSRTIEGPLYVAGARLSKGEARMDDGTDPGEPFVIEGKVAARDGKTSSPAPSSTSGTPIRGRLFLNRRRTGPTTCAAASRRTTRVAI